MRVIDQNGNTITEYDQTNGQLILVKAIREDAEPIDNVTKWAWAEEDWEEVQMYIPTTEKTTAEQIAELKAQLSATDYKIIKCGEYQLAGQDLPYDVDELHAQRQALRDQINQLEHEE